MVIFCAVKVDKAVDKGSRIDDIIGDFDFFGFVNLYFAEHSSGFIVVVLIVEIAAAQLHRDGKSPVQTGVMFSVFFTAVDTGGTAHETESLSAPV